MCSVKNYMQFCGVKAVVFDLDGTLIDTMKYFGEVASAVINKYYGVPIEKAKEMYFETSGIPFFQQLEVMFPGDKRNSAAAEEYERNKTKFFFDEDFPEELKRILRETKREYPQFIFVVSSNNFENLVKEYMKRHNVDVFDEVLGYRDNFAKGNDHFSYIEKKYGLIRREIMFIGDSWWDAEMALTNNVKFLAITTTFDRNIWKEKYGYIPVIEDFRQLKDVFEVITKCRQ